MSVNKGRNSHQKRKLKIQLFRGRLVCPCCFCGRGLSLASATLEHYTPLSQGGGWDKENLRISCDSCNGERAAEDFHSFRARKRGKNVTAQNAATT